MPLLHLLKFRSILAFFKISSTSRAFERYSFSHLLPSQLASTHNHYIINTEHSQTTYLTMHNLLALLAIAASLSTVNTMPQQFEPTSTPSPLATFTAAHVALESTPSSVIGSVSGLEEKEGYTALLEKRFDFLCWLKSCHDRPADASSHPETHESHHIYRRTGKA